MIESLYLVYMYCMLLLFSQTGGDSPHFSLILILFKTKRVIEMAKILLYREVQSKARKQARISFLIKLVLIFRFAFSSLFL
jgi:hypothetical protein